MAQFESSQADFAKQGARVWFIAAEKRRGMFGPEKFFEKQPSSFPFLLDEDRAVTKAYGVYQRLNIDGWNIAHPASFVVAGDGRVRYIYIGATQFVRAPLEQVFQALDAAK